MGYDLPRGPHAGDDPARGARGEGRPPDTAGRRVGATLEPLLRVSPTPVLRIRDGMLSDLNEAAMVLLGWDVDRIGRPIDELSDPRAPSGAGRSWASVVDETVEGRRAIHPWVFRRGDGVPIAVRVELAVIREAAADEALAHLRVDPIEDETDPERLQAHRLELLGQLTGGIAHDFNNLLTAIDGNIELAAKTIDDERAANSLEIASACARRAAQLSRRLLEFHRTPTFDPRPTDAGGVLESTLEFLGPLLRPDIVTTLDRGAALPAIPADHVQLQQALMNLVLNAQAAMPEGGTLWLRAGEQWVDDAFVARYPWGRAGRYVRIEVEDTGVGIDPGECEKIFRPFYSSRRRDHGTGLGLSIVYGIVKQHRGFIGVESALGRGTLFWILLPVEAPTRHATAGVVAADPDAGRPVALVLEDEEVVRQLAASVLEHDGYEVLEASSESEARGLLSARGRLDLLVADLMITGGSAVRFVRALRRAHPGLPVIYSSGYDPQQLNLDLDLDERSTFLGKPYRLSELREASRTLAGDAPRPPASGPGPVC